MELVSALQFSFFSLCFKRNVGAAFFPLILDALEVRVHGSGVAVHLFLEFVHCFAVADKLLF